MMSFDVPRWPAGFATAIMAASVATAHAGSPGVADGDEWRLLVATCDERTTVDGLPPGYVSVFERPGCDEGDAVDMLPAPVSRYRPPRHGPPRAPTRIYVDGWGWTNVSGTGTRIIYDEQRALPRAPVNPIPAPPALTLFAPALGLLAWARHQRSKRRSNT